MPHADFVHLRVHSAYSLAEGAIHIKDLVARCAQGGMPAVALTDTGNLFGALEFCEAAAGAGVQPIVGCALAVSNDDGARNGRRPAPDRLVLLAQDEAGYANLMKLSSRAFMETEAGETAQVGWDVLAEHAAGLIALSGGLDGPVGRPLAEGQAAAARAALERLAGLFPGRLYVELQRHGLEAEQRIEPILLDWAYALDLPLVATNDAFFPTRELHEAHDILLCIDQGVVEAEQERRRLTAEHYLKSAEEMRALFADLPEAVDNTLVIARRCAVRSPLRQPILPRFTVDGVVVEDEAAVLRQMSAEGLEERIAAVPEAEQAPYRERLEFELKVIIEMGFAGYFLIVADFIQWAKAQDIPVGPGRGSGAGSVVAWSLKITDLDPLRFNLLFERFLNPDRVSMPDFDIDFCQDRRDEVIRYVQDKYGHDQVAQIITFGKLQARAVLRDVGRVLGMPYGQVDRICKLVPYNPANPVSLAEAIEAEPRLREERDREPVVKRLFDLALPLEGLYRHASTHAAGVVIGDRPLDELIPVYRDPRSEMPVTQFNMKWVEPAGLIKFDFLGLKTLTVIDRTCKLLRARGVDIDIMQIPLDDPPTYAMLQKAEAVGVFQFESGGMRDLLREAVPANIEDLIALVALYRPGPMENIPKYVACKHGREEPELLHETIEPVVADTYGVIIYQEQVMQIAQVFAGYSLGQADLLRRAMGKKIKAEMQAQRDVFVKGAMARGVDMARAEYVFDLVDKFAGYGFNKAHSAGYALLAYQTAWLKANHPVEFLAASMTLDLGNTDKLNVFRQELDRRGIALLPPDVNRSGVSFAVERDGEGRGAVRYALAAVRNVGREAMRALVAEREANGPFASLWDLAARLPAGCLNKRQLENLARAGAFDGLHANRAELFENADMVLRYAATAAEERVSDQTSLFGSGLGNGSGGDNAPPPPRLNARADWSATERLSQEFEALGFYLSAHPLDAHRAALERENVAPAAEAHERAARGGTWFKLAGTVLGKQERRSARGNRFAFVQLSDSSGMFEIAVFSEELAAHRDLLEPGQSLVLEVEARSDGDLVRFTAQKLKPVEAIADRPGGAVRIFLHDAAPLPHIRAVLEEARAGHGRVYLNLALDAPGEEVELTLPPAYRVDASVRAALKHIAGVIDVHDA